jgi:hypothetical protein
LNQAGYQPEDIYSFFEKYNFTTKNGKGLRDEVQYDEVFIPLSRISEKGS